MPLILGIDTALGEVCISLTQGEKEISAFHSNNREQQAAMLLPWIEQVLQQANKDYADLDALAVTTGPGGFTGIRIGLASARAIGFAAKKPVLGFSTLQLMAENKPEEIICALPAGRGQLFTQIFKNAQSTAPAIMQPQTEITGCSKLVTTNAVDWDTPLKDTAIFHDVSRNGFLLTQLALRNLDKADDFLPVPLYIRPPDAKKSVLQGKIINR